MKVSKRLAKRVRTLVGLSLDATGVLSQDRVERVLQVIKKPESKDRLPLLKAYIKAVERKHAEQQVVVSTALPLNESEQTEMITIAKKRFGNNAQVSFLVDQAIISGIKMRSFDTIIDDTLAGRFQQLRDHAQGIE